MKINELSGKIIGCAIEVHRHLGPGLLESAYSACLAQEFRSNGIVFEREKPIPVNYKNVQLDCGYRLDFWVENRVVVELKCVEQIMPVMQAQMITYLRLTEAELGLMFNFKCQTIKDGMKRFIKSRTNSS